MKIDIKSHASNESFSDRMAMGSRIRSKSILISRFVDIGIDDHIIEDITKVSPDEFPIYQNIHDAVEYEIFRIVVRMIRDGLSDEVILKYLPNCNEAALMTIRDYEAKHPSDELDF